MLLLFIYIFASINGHVMVMLQLLTLLQASLTPYLE